MKKKPPGVENDRELVEARIRGAEQTDADAKAVDEARRRGLSPLDAAHAVLADREKNKGR